MARSRLRQFINDHPLLDRLRLAGIATFFEYGIAFMDRSYTIVRVAPDSVRDYIDNKKQGLFAICHGQVVGLLRVAVSRKRVRILVSQSRDGEIIARALSQLGFVLARGSAARGAIAAAKTMLKAAKTGDHLVMTVDGPRGPAFEVKEGIIRIAHMTGLPLIPLVCSAREAGHSWGWDKFLLPDYGTTMLLIYGEPIWIPKESDAAQLEDLRQHLEDVLTKLRAAAEEYWSVVQA